MDNVIGPLDNVIGPLDIVRGLRPGGVRGPKLCGVGNLPVETGGGVFAFEFEVEASRALAPLF